MISTDATEKKRWKPSPDQMYHNHLKSKYGIGLTDYHRMVREQDGRCGCCQKLVIPNGKSRLVVDHCHKTGVIRGLLCVSCNTAAGRFGDNVAGACMILAYLAKHENKYEVAKQLNRLIEKFVASRYIAIPSPGKSVWIFQNHRCKIKKGDSASWLVGWFDDNRRRRSRTIGSKQEAEAVARKMMNESA